MSLKLYSGPLTLGKGGGLQIKGVSDRYRAAIMALGPLAYWRLGEASGTNAAEENGLYPGTYNGAVTLGASGALTKNTAVTFPGANTAYMEVPNNAALNLTGAISIVCFAKPTNFSTFRGILGKTAAGSPRPYDFYLNSTDGKPKFFTGASTMTATAAPSTGVWSHLAVTLSAVNVRNWTHYLNGAANGTGTTSPTPTTSTGTLRIGGRDDGVTIMNGGIDEVAIFAKELTAQNIADLYALVS